MRPRLLQVMGMRAAESPGRAKLPPCALSNATSGRREVTDLLAIHSMTTSQVWDTIAESRAADLVHPIYDEGLPRASCSLCVLGSRAALVRGAQIRPDLAQEYLEVVFCSRRPALDCT